LLIFVVFAIVVGGQTYGVAKETTIVSVKVLDSDGNGYMSDVIAAIQYVINQKRKNPLIQIILNMSLGGTINESLNNIIATGANDYNIHFIVSAGNNYRNACRQSPAMSDNAITVGATTIRDKMALYSNWGKCVDILAYVVR
jgi:cerevisin